MVPAGVGAHGEETVGAETGFGMMRMIEDQALGDELHEEMEELMVKMMSGMMTETEAKPMVALMEENPGVHGMMTSRLMGMQFAQNSALGQLSGMKSGNFTMMPFGGVGLGTGFWFWIFSLTTLVWLAVGILAIVWLWKQIKKE